MMLAEIMNLMIVHADGTSVLTLSAFSLGTGKFVVERDTR